MTLLVAKYFAKAAKGDRLNRIEVKAVMNARNLRNDSMRIIVDGMLLNRS